MAGSSIRLVTVEMAKLSKFENYIDDSSSLWHLRKIFIVWLCWVWWCILVVLPSQEAEAGGLLELRNSR